MGFFSRIFNNNDDSYGSSSQNGRWQRMSFDERMMSILRELGDGYSVRRDIPIRELEDEAGMLIYTRGRKRCLPSDISYGIYRDGRRVLFIRSWESCSAYDRKANNEIRLYCRYKNIPLMDFFEYMPNEEAYMRQRISEAL